MAKYDPRSRSAEDFINDEEIRETLDYAAAHARLQRAEQVGEGRVVDVREVGEARAPLGAVRAAQGVDAREVEVVLHGHERAGREIGVQPAGGVGQERDGRAQAAEQLHGVDHGAEPAALVVMPPPAEEDDAPPREGGAEELAVVPGHGAGAEAVERGVGHAGVVVERLLGAVAATQGELVVGRGVAAGALVQDVARAPVDDQRGKRPGAIAPRDQRCIDDRLIGTHVYIAEVEREVDQQVVAGALNQLFVDAQGVVRLLGGDTRHRESGGRR